MDVCGGQALASAETAYTRAMTAVSKVALVGDCDGATLRAALHGFSNLPFIVGQVSSALLVLQSSSSLSARKHRLMTYGSLPAPRCPSGHGVLTCVGLALPVLSVCTLQGARLHEWSSLRGDMSRFLPSSQRQWAVVDGRVALLRTRHSKGNCRGI